MLLHRRVNNSTFPAEYRRPAARRSRNRWLQCGAMRIELPSASWADTVHRAEEDAHTLTVAAAQPATDWLGGLWQAGAAQKLRTEVPASEPVVLTLTL